MEFMNQWSNRPEKVPQRFEEPTCTVPNQSMTVQEIIAKYSRTGLVPRSFAKKDDGGNVATDPDFDPLDSGYDVMEAAAAASRGPEHRPDVPAGGSGPDDGSAPGEGEGGA